MTNVSRIAWVVGVGASRGLGAASARRFAREGYEVAATGRSPDALQVIVDEIMAAGGQAIQQPVTLSKRVKWLIFSTGWRASALLRWAFTMRATRFGGRRSKQKRQTSRWYGGSVASGASSSGGRLPAACCRAVMVLSSTAGSQQLFAEEQHLLHRRCKSRPQDGQPVLHTRIRATRYSRRSRHHRSFDQWR